MAKRRPLVEKICVTCHKVFMVKAYREKSRRNCSKACLAIAKRLRQIGDKNSNWNGVNANLAAGHRRAQRKFALQPCVVCDSKKSERHHIDGNPMNNVPENIRFLCRKHHMQEDGRLIKWLAGNAEWRREQKG